jgi:hypothetical protein
MSPDRLHRDPPKPVSTELPALPVPEIIDGRLAYPSVFLYEWRVEGMTFRSPLPPPRMPREAFLAMIEGTARVNRPRMPAPGYEPTWPYRVVPKPGMLAVFDALVRTGVLRDPQHTGRARAELEPTLPMVRP